MRHALVFVAVALADALWTGWMRSVDAHAPLAAGLYSAAIVLSAAYVTLAYIHDRRYLVPAALGAFVGTYLSVLYA